MSMRPCHECGTEISDKATNCPKCGAPAKKKTSGCAVLIAAGATVLVIGALLGRDPESAKPGAAQPRARTGQSKELQAEREALFADLRNDGVFDKMECRDRIADVWVQDTFYGISFENKQKFTSVVYAYCFGTSEENGLVIIKDDRTGKKVGSYGALAGLDLE